MSKTAKFAKRQRPPPKRQRPPSKYPRDTQDITTSLTPTAGYDIDDDGELILLSYSPTWTNVEPLSVGKLDDYSRMVGETEESYEIRILGEHAVKWRATRKARAKERNLTKGTP